MTALVVAAGAALVVVGAARELLMARGERASVEDPANVRSTSHTIAVPSTAPVIVMEWSRDDASTAVGFSIRWSREPFDVPDKFVDLPPFAVETRRLLSPGEWYFHLRTGGGEGVWTSTVHVGPFLIAAVPTPLPPPRSAPPSRPPAQPPAPPLAPAATPPPPQLVQPPRPPLQPAPPPAPAPPLPTPPTRPPLPPPDPPEEPPPTEPPPPEPPPPPPAD